jgi:hypothetical protein
MADFAIAEFQRGGGFADAVFRDRLHAPGVRVESELNFWGAEFMGDVVMRSTQFGIAAVFDNCTFHEAVLMSDVKAEVIKMNWSTFHGYTDLRRDCDFELHVSMIKKDSHAILPKG